MQKRRQTYALETGFAGIPRQSIGLVCFEKECFVISSRRLAREWALKILYQVDVGKVSLLEAQEAALERLRLEFVHKGSRTASGSRAEQVGLDAVTIALHELLPALRWPLERAISAMVGRLFEEMPYWQEARFGRSFRAHVRGMTLTPPQLIGPLVGAELLLDSVLPDARKEAVSSLTAEELAGLDRFALRMREALPRLMEPELRKTALVFAKDLAKNRPLGMGPDAVQDWLRKQRAQFNADSVARWLKVGQMVQKQTDDWMRVAAFTIKLVSGVETHVKEIDHAVSDLASGWKLERQVAVDRNILRMAGFEMLFFPGVPTSASINEAVELAKKYSTAESGRFVNGVLGALAQQVGDKLTPSDTAEQESEGLDAPLDLPEVSELEENELEENEPEEPALEENEDE